MRRSPLDGFDLRVSVEKLEAPSLWGALQATMASTTGRFSPSTLAIYLHRRATIHVSVLALAAAVLAASALNARGPQTAISFTGLAGGTDSLDLAAKSAIVARSLPFTTPNGESTYVVQGGDTLTAISRKTGVGEEALLAYNGLSSSDALNVGLQLRVPDLSQVPADQLRIKDTAPHESTPLVSQSGSETLPPQKPAPELTIHEVQRGDSASKLAAEAGVSEATVLASNNLQKSTVLSLGQTLVIPSISGRLVATKPGDTVAALAAKYGSTIQGVIAANKLDQRTTAIAPDQLVLVPADPDVAAALVKDVPPPTPAQAKPQTAPAEGETAKLAVPAQAEEASPVKPLPAPRPAALPGFIWPAPGVITTYFSSWHNGVDIANRAGTPVRAVQAGRVVFAGWNNTGFGYMVRIDHGDGLQTLYGHASRLIAKVGDEVQQGQIIMLMGSTGHSTGPHVHFSVFQGSSYNAFNPLKFLP